MKRNQEQMNLLAFKVYEFADQIGKDVTGRTELGKLEEPIRSIRVSVH